MKIELMNLLRSMNTPGEIPPTITLERANEDHGDPSRDAALVSPSSLFSRSNCAWATGVTVAGLCLHSYYVRELAASMVLFSVLFVSLALVSLSAWFVWRAGKQVATWARPASQTRGAIPDYRASHLRP